MIGAGPLWFVEVLLIFSLVYALWRRFFRPNPPVPPVETESRFPGNAAIVLFALLTGVGAFLVRLVFPVDWNFSLLNLQFPFFVLYIALFIVGLIAYRRNWLLGLPDAKGKLWLGIAIALILLFVPMALIGGGLENDQPFKGGLYWQAMAYALWEAFLCMGMCIGLIYALPPLPESAGPAGEIPLAQRLHRLYHSRPGDHGHGAGAAQCRSVSAAQVWPGRADRRSAEFRAGQLDSQAAVYRSSSMIAVQVFSAWLW